MSCKIHILKVSLSSARATCEPRGISAAHGGVAGVKQIRNETAEMSHAALKAANMLISQPNLR